MVTSGLVLRTAHTRNGDEVLRIVCRSKVRRHHRVACYCLTIIMGGLMLGGEIPKAYDELVLR